MLERALHLLRHRGLSRARRLLDDQRGAAALGIAIEGLLVVGWFVFVLLGHKVLADGVRGRRAAEDGAATSAELAASAYCEGPANTDDGTAQVMPNGRLGAGDIAGVVRLLGASGCPTMATYTLPFEQGEGAGVAPGIESPSPLASEHYSMRTVHRRACLERSLDQATGSLPCMRVAVFLRNVQGYR